MKFDHLKVFFHRSGMPALFFLILSGFVPWMAGCGIYAKAKDTTWNTFSRFKGAEKGLRQKTGILWPQFSVTFLDADLADTFKDTFTAALGGKSREMLVSRAGDKTFPRELQTIPKLPSGWVDNYALVQNGRQSGFSTLVIASLIDISGQQEESGLLWFKKIHRTVNVQGFIEIYDMETGAKLLDEAFAHTADVGQAEQESLNAGKAASSPMLKAAVTQLAVGMGEKTGRFIARQPWKGFVASVKKNQVILSSGEHSGLKPGMIFDVFDGGEIMEGKDGLKFIKPGQNKIGQIKLKRVHADRAEAELISGKLPPAGGTVRLPQ